MDYFDVNLSKGWEQYPGVTGGYHLEYDDGIASASMVTAPRGSGLMGHNDPGEPTTYEVSFSEIGTPMGHLSLEEVRGIIKYLHAKHASASVDN